MEILIDILFIIILVFVISSILTLFPKWKYYKKAYLSLTDAKFYRMSEDLIVGSNYNELDSFFCFLTDNKSIQIKEGIWLHNYFITFLDPYSCYYYWKFRKFFENIDIQSLPDYK